VDRHLTKTIKAIMGDVIPFKKPRPIVQQRGNTLCKRGFHKWEIVNDKQFDVREGRLVTMSRCNRCGKLKSDAR
jgi:hypothetical protein